MLNYQPCKFLFLLNQHRDWNVLLEEKTINDVQTYKK